MSEGKPSGGSGPGGGHDNNSTDSEDDRKPAARSPASAKRSAPQIRDSDDESWIEEDEGGTSSGRSKRKRQKPSDSDMMKDETSPKKASVLSLQEKWDEMYSRLVRFKETHGHCLVPNRYKDDPSLGAWVATQRRTYKMLVSGNCASSGMNVERAQRLMELGFEWTTTDPRHVPWDERFDELKAFVAEYGHAEVPMRWEKNLQLSNWVSKQRQDYKLLQLGKTTRLSERRRKLLEEIGFVWEIPRKGRRIRLEKLPPTDGPSEATTDHGAALGQGSVVGNATVAPSSLQPTGFPFQSIASGTQLGGSIPGVQNAIASAFGTPTGTVTSNPNPPQASSQDLTGNLAAVLAGILQSSYPQAANLMPAPPQPSFPVQPTVPPTVNQQAAQLLLTLLQGMLQPAQWQQAPMVAQQPQAAAAVTIQPSIVSNHSSTTSSSNGNHIIAPATHPLQQLAQTLIPPGGTGTSGGQPQHPSQVVQPPQNLGGLQPALVLLPLGFGAPPPVQLPQQPQQQPNPLLQLLQQYYLPEQAPSPAPPPLAVGGGGAENISSLLASLGVSSEALASVGLAAQLQQVLSGQPQQQSQPPPPQQQQQHVVPPNQPPPPQPPPGSDPPPTRTDQPPPQGNKEDTS